MEQKERREMRQQKTVFLSVPKEIGILPTGDAVKIKVCIVKNDGEYRVRRWDFVDNLECLCGAEQQRLKDMTPIWLIHCPNGQAALKRAFREQEAAEKDEDWQETRKMCGGSLTGI